MKPIATGNNFGVGIEEYEGIYSLTSYRGSDDKLYAQWAKYQVGKDKYHSKATPVKIVLGSKKEATAALEKLLKYFCGDKDDDDSGRIPF